MANSSTIARIIGTFALVLALILPITAAHKAQATSLPVLSACTILTSNLHYGSIDTSPGGGDVVSLQQFLAAQGYFSYAPTGYFGPVTFRAVQQFQLHNGIIGTGYVGPITRAKIQALTCGVQNDTLSISSMTPGSGPIGTTVTLTGHGFTPTTTIKFGSGAIVNTYVSYINSTLIRFVIPDYIGTYCAPGMYCVMNALAQQVTPGIYPVAAVDLNTVSNTVNFTVTNGTTSAPTINTISPAYGSIGTNVTISGNGFTEDSLVFFGGGYVRPNTISNSRITFTVPSTYGPSCRTCSPGIIAQSVQTGNNQVYVQSGNTNSNVVWFNVLNNSNGSVSITGLDAPTSLHMGTTGTWTVHAACITCAGGTLHYSVDWNDVYAYTGTATSSAATVQTDTTFTHMYTRTGTYHPVFTVSDDAGHSATTSASVVVQ